eukprot:Anaeramoba_flamelloidesa1054239_48.p1 GENE.a1054239_48~~a1054239_48.p1  ORF type:complete len:312 (+),score=50.77 a1054239_48:37-936(+)
MYQKVLKSIKDKNMDEFKEFLPQLQDINQKDEEKERTLLHYAVRLKREKFVSALLLLGCKVDVQDAKERTPFLYAIDRGFVTIVKKLLAFGSDVNQTDDYGSTALHLTALLNNVKMFKVLRAYGPDPTLSDQFNDTPLTLAENEPIKTKLQKYHRRYCDWSPSLFLKSRDKFQSIVISNQTKYKIELEKLTPGDIIRYDENGLTKKCMYKGMQCMVKEITRELTNEMHTTISRDIAIHLRASHPNILKIVGYHIGTNLTTNKTLLLYESCGYITLKKRIAFLKNKKQKTFNFQSYPFFL